MITHANAKLKQGTTLVRIGLGVRTASQMHSKTTRGYRAFFLCVCNLCWVHACFSIDTIFLNKKCLMMQTEGDTPLVYFLDSQF